LIIDQTIKPTAKKISWIGSLYYLFLFIGAGSYMPFLYVYFTDLGLNGRQIGWIAILGPVLMMTLSMPMAALADRFRLRVRITQLTNAGVCLIIFLLQFPKSFLGIAVLMFLISIFNSSGLSIAESLVARMAQRHELNYGTMRLWGSLGYALSALAFGAIWKRLGFGSMFVVTSILIIPLIWISGQLEEGNSVERRESQQSISVLLSDRGLLLLVLATFLAAISNSMAMTFSGIYARGLGGGNFLVGLMIAAGAFAELPAMFYNERLARLLRAPNTIILSYLLMALGYLGYIFTPTPSLIPLFSILKGLGYGLYYTNHSYSNPADPEHWGACQSDYSQYIWSGPAGCQSGGWLAQRYIQHPRGVLVGRWRTRPGIPGSGRGHEP
jgi:PPP family 3-phenylpropionic acid transporter